MAVPGGRWLLTIDAAGRYAFVNEGASDAASHSGTFRGEGGKWSLTATSMSLEDAGTYKVGGGSLTLKGRRATTTWARSAVDLAAAPRAAPAAAPAPGPVAVPVAAAPAPAAARVAAAVQAPPPVRAASPTPARGASLPATIDPCLLVSAEEAARTLGASVTTSRTTPQPHAQNDCRYRASNGTYLGVTTYNGGGLDPTGYLEQQRKRGGVALAGVGDGAYLSYRDITGLGAVDFVIGTASFEILTSGLDRNRSLAALKALALQASGRLTSSAAAFEVPGLERFVGSWLVATQPKNGGTAYPNLIFTVGADGELRGQTVSAYGGTLQLAAGTWRLDNPNGISLGGRFTSSAARWSLSGDPVSGELTRVACNQRPKFTVPYLLTRDLTGFLDGRALASLNPNPPPAQTFDAALAGLWEGQGALKNVPAHMLVAVDARGRAAFALFLQLHGHLAASDGRFRLRLDGEPEQSGTYKFAGGVDEGAVALEDAAETMRWVPFDPDKRPPYETPILGRCQR